MSFQSFKTPNRLYRSFSKNDLNKSLENHMIWRANHPLPIITYDDEDSINFDLYSNGSSSMTPPCKRHSVKQTTGELLIFDDLFTMESPSGGSVTPVKKNHNHHLDKKKKMTLAVSPILPLEQTQFNLLEEGNHMVVPGTTGDEVIPTTVEEGEEVDKLQKARRDVIDEIIATERTFVEGLTLLVNQYVIPMKNLLSHHQGTMMASTTTALGRVDVSPSFSDKRRLVHEWSSMFAPINVIIRVNQQLLSELEQRIVNSSNNRVDEIHHIGLIFQNMAPMFKTYTAFITNYNRTITRLTEILKSNTVLNQFLKQREKEMRALKKNTMNQYLITPAQRLTRYHLLLTELLKNMEETSRDYSLIRSARDQTKGVADYVNASVAEWENRLKIIELRDEIHGLDGKVDLIQAHRKFVSSHINVKWLRESSKMSHVFKHIRLIIFSDMIIVCRRGKYKTHFMFTEEPIPWPDKNVKCADNKQSHECEDCKLKFDLVTKNEVITFMASSEQQRDEIYSEIRTQTDNLRSNNPNVKSADKADPLRQRPALSAKMLRRKFSLRRSNDDKVLQYSQFRDEIPVSPTAVPKIELGRGHKSPIVGLDLSGLSNDDEKVSYSKTLDPRQLHSYRSRNRPQENSELSTTNKSSVLASALDDFFDCGAISVKQCTESDPPEQRPENPYLQNGQPIEFGADINIVSIKL